MKANYVSCVTSTKLHFFSLFTGLALLVTCIVVFQYVVKFCSEDGSWRYWFLISEGFTWSLEELGALGSSVEAGGLVKVTIWSHKLAHTFKIMVLSTTTGDKNMRNHYENLVRPKHTKTPFAPSPIHVLINPRVRKGLC